jgi:hypothetical protein
MEDCNGLAQYLIIVLFGSQQFIKMWVYKVVEKDSDWLGSWTSYEESVDKLVIWLGNKDNNLLWKK